ILAVDASGSVNNREFGLQLGGIADAFRTREIQSAAASGPEGRIAVALMIWSDAALPKITSSWRLVGDAASAEAFALEVASFIPKRGSAFGQSGAGTGIGAALEYALTMFPRNGIDAPRRTVDVSGDGIETTPWFQEAMELPQARALAAADGVTVNGLAILSDDRSLGAYYEAELITGPGAFVIEAATFEDFAEAIRRKLLAEIQVFVGEGPAATTRAAALSPGREGSDRSD
ncbi:MAG: DUF1194 domain-containing protein, partial [Pseudomonadota bacterium]